MKMKTISPFLKNMRKYSHAHPFVKFLIVFSFFVLYLCFSVINFGFENGILVSILTWSFFVFCTPIADAGILFDFPLRLIARIRMIYSEMMVWIVAFFINAFAFTTNPHIYEKTIILLLFKHIIQQPFPFWIIILLSAIGTFLSVYFGDEILDILLQKKRKRENYEKHNVKYEIVLFVFIIIAIIILYSFILSRFNLSIPLV